MPNNTLNSIFQKILSPSTDTRYTSDSRDSDLHTPEEILEDICSKIDKTSELEMELQIHDLIIKNVEYDDSGKHLDHEALGILVNHKGVCDGISKLADMIFRKVGIESYVVVGTMHPFNDAPGAHAWNIVKIDNNWYNLDVTADLCLTKVCHHYRYDYFNLSDKEISTDHTASTTPFKCVTSNRDYYSMNGLFVADVEMFKKMVRKTLKSTNKSLTIRLPQGLDPVKTEEKLIGEIMTMCRTYMKRPFRCIHSMNND